VETQCDRHCAVRDTRDTIPIHKRFIYKGFITRVWGVGICKYSRQRRTAQACAHEHAAKARTRQHSRAHPWLDAHRTQIYRTLSTQCTTA